MNLYGDPQEAARLMYGQNARHVPAWLYVQDHGQGTVGFVGASRATGGAHPLRYDSNRTHQFIVGEIIVRPHLVIATDALRGMGAGNLYLGCHEFGEMLGNGEVIAGSEATLARIRAQWEGA